MNLRRAALGLAALLAGLLLVTVIALRRQHISVSVDQLPSGPGMAPEPVPPSPTAASELPGGAPGEPAQEGYTNEMQAANLEKQKKAAGIAGIIAPKTGDRQALMAELSQARTPDEAMSALQQLSAMNEDAREQAGHRAPIYVAGKTPRLLAQAGGASSPEKGEPVSFEDWSGAGAVPLGKNRVIEDQDSWAGFWQAAFGQQPVPDVDFTQEEVAVVIAGPVAVDPSGGPVPGESLEIVSAQSQGSDLVVSYRHTRPLNGAASAAKEGVHGALWLCALKKIPRTGLEVQFAETP